MKLVSFYNHDQATMKFTIVPPCEGYYTNITMMWHTLGGAQGEEAIQFYLGTELNEDVFDQIPASSGDRQIGGQYLGKKGILLKFPAMEDVDGTLYTEYFKHFGNKRLYINSGEVLHVMSRDPFVGVQSMVMINAHFIPKPGAVLHQKFESSFDEGDDFGTQAATPAQNPRIYRFPQSMKNVQVKATLNCTWDTNDYQGILYFKKQKRGQDWFADTVSAAQGDILDTDYIDNKYASLHGIIGSVPFHTRQTAAAATADVTTFNAVLNVGNVQEGDFLTWDVEDVGADTAMNGTFVLNLEIAGVVAKRFWSKEGDFLVAPHVFDLNSADTALEMS